MSETEKETARPEVEIETELANAQGSLNHNLTQNLTDTYPGNLTSNLTHKAWIYFLDVGVCMAGYYGLMWFVAFKVAAVLPQSQQEVQSLVVTILSGLAASFLLYRVMLFSHEMVHFKQSAQKSVWSGLRWFRWYWHILAGIPFLMPSFFLRGHIYHHATPHYGTVRDPEYLPFARLPSLRWRFVVFAALTPVMLLFRAAIAVPLSWVWPPVSRVLLVKYSCMAMHNAFDASRLRVSRFDTLMEVAATVFVYSIAAVCVFKGGENGYFGGGVDDGVYKALAFWFCTSALAAMWNNFRVLFAHRYRSDYQGMSREAQFMDSCTLVVLKAHPASEGLARILGALRRAAENLFWIFFAPVGQRYHALHHLYPHLPYHALRQVHKSLLEAKTAQARAYRQTVY